MIQRLAFSFYFIMSAQSVYQSHIFTEIIFNFGGITLVVLKTQITPVEKSGQMLSEKLSRSHHIWIDTVRQHKNSMGGDEFKDYVCFLPQTIFLIPNYIFFSTNWMNGTIHIFLELFDTVLVHTRIQWYLYIRVLQDTNFPRYELGNEPNRCPGYKEIRIHHTSHKHLVMPSHL